MGHKIYEAVISLASTAAGSPVPPFKVLFRHGGDVDALHGVVPLASDRRSVQLNRWFFNKLNVSKLKEVAEEDLPLYISWPYKYPAFFEHFKTGVGDAL